MCERKTLVPLGRMAGLPPASRAATITSLRLDALAGACKLFTPGFGEKAAQRPYLVRVGNAAAPPDNITAVGGGGLAEVVAHGPHDGAVAGIELCLCLRVVSILTSSLFCLLQLAC